MTDGVRVGHDWTEAQRMELLRHVGLGNGNPSSEVVCVGFPTPIGGRGRSRAWKVP